MNESRQPFTEHVTRRKAGTSQTGWIVAGIFGVLALALFFLWVSARVDQQDRQKLKAELDETIAKLAAAQSENATNLAHIALLKARIADLEKEKEQAAHMAKGLEEELRADLESKDVTISKLQGKLTVNILDRVMFDSGEAVLKPGGEAVMRKIAAMLAEHPELKIHVIGHTDNIPIRSRFASNWELSTARALAAVHFLTERADVDPRRVGAVGYGEYRPIADNSTPEGRAKNRRIAITILPDELATADSPVLPKTEPTTNSPSEKNEPGIPLQDSK